MPQPFLVSFSQNKPTVAIWQQKHLGILVKKMKKGLFLQSFSKIH